MKKKIGNIILYSSALFSLMMTGCGDSLLEDLDENVSVSDKDDTGLEVINNYGDLGGSILNAEIILFGMPDVGNQNNPHKYQAKFNLYLDNFGGYMASTQNFNGNLPTTYSYFGQHAESPKSSFFEVAQSTLPVVRSAEKFNVKEIGAIASILYSYAALEIADIYGPMPWYDYKNDKQEPPLEFVTLREVYENLFKDLKEANSILSGFKDTSKEHRDSINDILRKYDRIFVNNLIDVPVLEDEGQSIFINNDENNRFKDLEGDLSIVENWRRFANTIRLRMALRMSNIENGKYAKEELVSAYNDGLLTVPVQFNDASYTQHPLYPISTGWNDTKLNASYENILKRLNCPLLELLFDKNTGDIEKVPAEEGDPVETIKADSMIIGIRCGVPLGPRDDTNKYTKFSPVSENVAKLPVTLMKVSEVYFLLAEAHVRWPDAIEYPATETRLYQTGITEMFKAFGLTEKQASDYFTSTTVNDVDYYDYTYSPKSKLYMEEGKVTLPVRFTGTNQEKIEKIITQKWIGNFPYGLEAWNDLRRTGYPRIFIQQYDSADGSLAGGEIIRRLPWDQSNGAMLTSIATGIKCLKEDNPAAAANEMAARLWWDVEDGSGLSNNWE